MRPEPQTPPKPPPHRQAAGSEAQVGSMFSQENRHGAFAPTGGGGAPKGPSGPPGSSWSLKATQDGRWRRPEVMSAKTSKQKIRAFLSQNPNGSEWILEGWGVSGEDSWGRRVSTFWSPGFSGPNKWVETLLHQSRVGSIVFKQFKRCWLN